MLTRLNPLRKGMLLLFCFCVPGSAELSVAVQPENAGRNFTVGETLPDSIAGKIEAGLQSNHSSWKMVVCIFTKPEQRFSKRLKSDLSAFLHRHSLAGLDVIEIFVAQKTARESQWPLIFDPDSQLYQDVGLTVLPSVYLFDADWKIVGYFPGYSPTFTKTLRQNLASYYPELKEEAPPEISHNQQQYHRTENMAKALALRREYKLARTVLERADSLSNPGKILLGMLYFEAGEYQFSKDLFSALLEEGSLQNYVFYGLGITALAEKRPEIALQYLNKVESLSEQKTLDRARAFAKEEMNNLNSSVETEISGELNRESLLIIP